MINTINGKIKEWSAVFAWLMIPSVISYSLLIFNGVFNDTDGTWHGSISYGGGWELGEGRWLWPYLDKARAYLSPDPLASIVSLAIFATGFILVLDLLRITNKKTGVLAGLLFMIGTPICCSLSYRYMSHIFATAFLLAVIAAYCEFGIRNKWIAMLAAALFISLSMGLYQADLGSTVTVMLVVLITRAWRMEAKVREMLLDGGRCIISVLAGGLLYFGLWQAELIRQDVDASSYGGADSVSIGGMIEHLPETLYRTVRYFAAFFGNNMFKVTMLPRGFHAALILIFAAVSMCVIFQRFRKDRGNAALLLILTLVIPLFPMCTYILTYKVEYMSGQMTAPLALCFALMLCLTFEYITDIEKNTEAKKIKPAARLTGAVVVLLSVISLYGQHLMAQYDMYAMYMGRRSVETIAYEVMDELIAGGLYSAGVNYCFVGSPSDNQLYVKNDVFEKCNNYARYGDWGNVSNDNRQGWQGFMMNVMGINMGIADSDVIDEMTEDPVVLTMPVFPAKGSVAAVGDNIVIKLSE